MVKEFSREWYEERGELGAHDNFVEYLRIEMSMDVHEAIWGVPCGPTRSMVSNPFLTVREY